MSAINLAEKFAMITDHWHPHVIAEANGQHIRLAKLSGEFVWHNHEAEDELFLVVKGQLKVHFRDKIETVSEGEILVIPKGVDHMPVAENEVLLVNITAAQTSHTGSVKSDITVEIKDMPRL